MTLAAGGGAHSAEQQRGSPVHGGSPSSSAALAEPAEPIDPVSRQPDRQARAAQPSGVLFSFNYVARTGTRVPVAAKEVVVFTGLILPCVMAGAAGQQSSAQAAVADTAQGDSSGEGSRPEGTHVVKPLLW